jgi:hypothetical protein
LIFNEPDERSAASDALTRAVISWQIRTVDQHEFKSSKAALPHEPCAEARIDWPVFNEESSYA